MVLRYEQCNRMIQILYCIDMSQEFDKSTEQSFSMYIDDVDIDNFNNVNELYNLQSIIHKLSIEKERNQIKIQLQTKTNKELKSRLSMQEQRCSEMLDKYNDKEKQLHEKEEQLGILKTQNNRHKQLISGIPKVNGRPSIQLLLFKHKQLIQQHQQHQQQVQTLREQNNRLSRQAFRAQNKNKLEREEYEKQIKKLMNNNEHQLINHKLKNNIKQLQQSKAQLQKHSEVLRSKMAQVQQQNKQIHCQLTQKRRQLYRREQYILYNTNHQLVNETQEQQHTIKELKTKINLLNESNDKLSMDNKKLESKIEILQMQLSKQVKNTQVTNTKYEELYHKYSQYLNNKNSQIQEIINNETKIHNINNNNIKSIIKHNNQQDLQLQHKLQKEILLSEDNAKLRTQLINYKQLYHNLKNKYAQEHHNKSITITQLTHKIKQYTFLNNEYQSQIFDLKQQVQKGNSKVDKLNEIIIFKSNQLQQLQNIHDNVCPKVKGQKIILQQKYGELKEQQITLSQEYDKVVKGGSQSQEKVHNIQIQMHKCLGKVQLIQAQNKQLRSQIKGIKQNNRKEICELLQKINILQYLINKHKAQNVKLQQQIVKMDADHKLKQETSEKEMKLNRQRRAMTMHIQAQAQTQTKEKGRKEEVVSHQKVRSKSQISQKKQRQSIDSVIQTFRKENKQLMKYLK